jgi:hypothetical protein
MKVIDQDNEGYPSLVLAKFAHNPTPIAFALPATDVSGAGFTANWEDSDGADSYLIDISVDEDFSTFILDMKIFQYQLKHHLYLQMY